MNIRVRPDGCCANPNEPSPQSASERERHVAIFKALADATRLEIFRLIAAQDDPICACDVVDRFDVSQPTISYHLRVLREAGLIDVSRRGIWAYYAVNETGVDLARQTLEAIAPRTLAPVR
jgi:ArsR family transcriptional regulator, arsenate/arsenite/antimonite-responsive transcriptional repressor